MDQIESRRQARRRCATVIIIAAAGFLVGCFLPYYYRPASFGAANLKVSLYHLETPLSDTGSTFLPRIGGVIYLFGLVIIVAWVAILGLVNDSDWTFGALAGPRPSGRSHGSQLPFERSAWPQHHRSAIGSCS